MRRAGDCQPVGGLVDTIVHGETGLHVPPRRPDMVVAAARQMLADADMRKRLGRAGARRARDRFGWDAVANGHASQVRGGGAAASIPGGGARRRPRWQMTPPLLVIGDCMLDRDVCGSVDADLPGGPSARA